MSEPDVWDVVVVGAGAAGLMAAISASQSGARTLLLEKNRRPGIKILMSGGTRCNITQATDNRGIVAAFGRQGNFLHSPLAAFSVEDTIEFFNRAGVATKVEPTGKVFPISDDAADVLAALLSRLGDSGAELAIEEPLERIDRDGEQFRLQTARRTLRASKVVVTTGGVSYPGSGTTGDGYGWAESFGHTIVVPRPALTPVTVDAAWVRNLQGVTLPDVSLRVIDQWTGEQPAGDRAGAGAASGSQRVLDERRGAMLFTHFGLSGPAVLDCSRVVSGHPEPRRLVLSCDLLADVPRAALEDDLRRRAAKEGKRRIVSILPEHLPRRLLESVLELAGVDGAKPVAEMGRGETASLVEALKGLRIAVTGTRGFKKAEVTAGGVALSEVDSRTMHSKLAANLYLAGEVLDLDGPIGGYNFQAAWSTGFLAGRSAAAGS